MLAATASDTLRRHAIGKQIDRSEGNEQCKVEREKAQQQSQFALGPDDLQVRGKASEVEVTGVVCCY